MATIDTKAGESAKPTPSLLLLLPLLILAGLLLIPSTHTLMKNQLTLLVDVRAYADHLRDYGVKTGPMPVLQKWEHSRPAELIAQQSQDYTIQIAGALLRGAVTPVNSGVSPQEHYAGFQLRYGNALTAISQRFPHQPGAYAHLLRFMAMGTVRVSREAEATKFQRFSGAARPMLDRQSGCTESWDAYDAAAAQGEQIDPDNAYFPLMRAVGLFDARRDREALAAVLRAGQKARFEDYSHEEPEAIQTLYIQAYGIDSALLRDFAYASVLLPHYAAIRAVARLVASKAAQEEQAGRLKEGLALRHALMQSGIRMRENGALICALVGIACYSIAMQAPGGVIPPPPPANADDQTKRALQLQRYQDYLHRHQESAEAAWVARENAINEEVRELISRFDQGDTLEKPFVELPGYWIADLLLLANTLGLLALCLLGAAGSPRNVKNGGKALPWAAGLLLFVCMLVAMPMQWAECFVQMRLLLESFSGAADGSGVTSRGVPISEIITRYPVLVHLGEVLISLTAPVLALLTTGVISLVRKEPYATALRRSLQRGALLSLTLLTIVYAGMLFATARIEKQANTVLESRARNAVAYLRSRQSGSRP